MKSKDFLKQHAWEIPEVEQSIVKKIKPLKLK